MTIEACLSFCDEGQYIYAGLEYSDCDSTIQYPSVSAPLSECDMPCAGNASESCGAGNLLNILWNGQPSPIFVSTVTNANGDTDGVSNRTLQTPVNIPNGVTAESCVAACQSLDGPLPNCDSNSSTGCDNALGAATQHVSDDDCRMVCDANHTEYCGNANRIAVYDFTPAGTSPDPPQCISTDVSNFTLVAVYNNPPVNGPSSVTLKAILVELVPNIAWLILSACPTCCSDWTYFTMENSVFFPQSLIYPSLDASSIGPTDGESPAFVSLNPPFPGSQSYCTVIDASSPTGSPPLLSFADSADSFSLCTNSSANNRLDVVYSPVTGHPNYSIDDCSPVTIQVISN
ncbi:hypothetical protein H0H92_005728 [Tricholoma furcatifolium]|nr:hypothetical protein H0H92_005728 [Tricholoma furcatifolium]